MKLPIALSTLILAVGAVLGWQEQQQLATVREIHEKLLAEAAQLGISIDPSHPADPILITKHGERDDKEADARHAAVEFIAFAKEMEAMEKKGEQPDKAAQQRIMTFMDRMMGLDSAQLKILITEVRNAKDLKDESRQGLVAFSIMTLAEKHPQAALALFTESSDLFKADGMGKHVISSSLTRWAKDDPAGALDWVRKNGEKFPDLITEDAKRGLISGAASNDPKLAFKLIGELGLKNDSRTINGIASAARTPEERTAMLAAVREYRQTLTDPEAQEEVSQGFASSLAGGLASQGFETASKWIEGASLTPAELATFTSSLSHQVKSAETGQWIEWIGKQSLGERQNDIVGGIVRNWAQNDFQATGAWLNTTPDGPVKETAIRKYAETVSRYEPEAAAQWAATLPQGKDRDETLRKIYDNWPKKDAASQAAAAAFAKKHYIFPEPAEEK